MSWHVDTETLSRYQAGTADRVSAASIETHLADCEQCRGRLAVDIQWLERSWAGIADRVEPGRLGVVERALMFFGAPSHLARLVVVSPVMRIPFLISLVLVLGFAVAVSNVDSPRETIHVFLAVAPLLPVAGVAFAYGPLVDPAHEITLAAPLDSLFLLLLRAATVLTVAITVSLLAWTLVPAADAIGVTAWLLPALALTFITLAAASRFQLWAASSVVGAGWLIFVAFSAHPDVRVFTGSAQLAYLAATVVGAGVIVLRRNSYNSEGGGR
jgi:hypothetical protein